MAQSPDNERALVEQRLEFLEAIQFFSDHRKEVVDLVAGSQDRSAAIAALAVSLHISELRATAIVDCRCARLTVAEGRSRRAEKERLLARLTELGPT